MKQYKTTHNNNHHRDLLLRELFVGFVCSVLLLAVNVQQGGAGEDISQDTRFFIEETSTSTGSPFLLREVIAEPEEEQVKDEEESEEDELLEDETLTEAEREKIKEELEEKRETRKKADREKQQELQKIVAEAALSTRRAWNLNIYLNQRTKYENNFTRSRDDERGELVVEYGPVFELVRNDRKLRTKLTYNPHYKKYFEFDQNSGLNQSFQGFYIYRFANLTLTGKETFSHEAQDSTSETTGRSETLSNAFSQEFAYRISPKFSPAFIISTGRSQFLQESQKPDSYTTVAVGARLYYHMRPTLDLYSEIETSSFDYFKANGSLNSENKKFVFGARGILGNKTILKTEAGLRFREYDDTTRDQAQGFWTEGIILHRLTPKLDLTVVLKRDIEESVYRSSGFFETTIFRSTIGYLYSPKTKFSMGLGLQSNLYPESTTEADPVTGVSITDKREDKLFTFDLSMAYKFRYNLFLDGGYTYTKKTSNFKTFDYKNSTYRMAVNYQF